MQQRQGKGKFSPSTATFCCGCSTRVLRNSRHSALPIWKICSVRFRTSTAACSSCTTLEAERYAGIQIPRRGIRAALRLLWPVRLAPRHAPLRNDREINPDVLGYIFEKYINQKQMGAYYTKEDITEYIAKNTVFPTCSTPLRRSVPLPSSPMLALWRLLRDDPDRYIYEPVRKGVDLQLPAEIEQGCHRCQPAQRLESPC